MSKNSPMRWLLSLEILLSGCGAEPARQQAHQATALKTRSSASNPSLDERIETHIGLLTNESIGLRDCWTLQFGLRSESAGRLVWVGKPATEMLLGALRDPGKAVAAHVVLTAIWEPVRSVCVSGESSQLIAFRCDRETFIAGDPKGEGAALYYRFNGLKCEQQCNGSRCVMLVTDDQVHRAEEHWREVVAADPVTDADYADAEARWAEEIAKIVPVLPRAQRKP